MECTVSIRLIEAFKVVKIMCTISMQFYVSGHVTPIVVCNQSGQNVLIILC